MNPKIYAFVLFCALLWATNEIDAQVIKCDYSYDIHRIIGYKNTSVSYYKCNLDTRQANFNENPTIIDGQHGTGHTDGDVKWLANYKDNKLKTFSSIFCQKFPNLEVVQIKNAEMESMDENSLSNCKHLENVFLEGNKIHELPDYLLNGNSRLNHFWIQNNQLTTLPENLFLNQKDLGFLILGENQINFLPSSIFHPLVKLELLLLNNNKLQSINPEWFVNLQHLRWLGLNNNEISEVPSESFALLRHLEKLWLYESRIKTLYPDSFVGLLSLQILELEFNELSELPPNVFTPLKNLKVLNLSSNKLTTIHSDSFSVHNNLILVALNNNEINEIDEKFIDNTALSVLNMGNNLCSQYLFTYRSQIKTYLGTCFDNYQPRNQPEIHSYQQMVASNQNSVDTCGKSIAGQGNIIGGAHITRGSFPWIAALVLTTGDYFCGGSLVSNRKVITAAHCMQEKQTNAPKSAGEFFVLLGAYDLNKRFEIGRISYAVQKINIHRDWNPLTEAYDADIAVLVLDRDVNFSEYIQPICLVDSQSNVATLTTGVVVGYGRSEDGTKVHENIPKILDTPIHTNEDCFLQNYLLVRLSSKRTFCGGTETGTGVCRGDSGGGLFVTNEKVFYLRGIVSSSLIGGPYGCDVDAYSIFTDVTKYVDWINGISTNRFD